MSNKYCPQIINGFLSLFDHMESTVLWMCTADYKKQLYVNRAYETIWGRSAESLQNNMGSWAETLLPEDLKQNIPKFKDRMQTLKPTPMHFRIFRPDGDLRFIRNVGYTFFDRGNLPGIIIGVDEKLSPEEWEEEQINPRNKQLVPAFSTDLFGILAKELHLLPAPTEAAKPIINKQLYIEGNKIFLTNRERDCLESLLLGKTAKQTGRQFNISPRTVETHLDNLRIKTKSRSKLELMAKVEKSFRIVD